MNHSSPPPSRHRTATRTLRTACAALFLLSPLPSGAGEPSRVGDFHAASTDRPDAERRLDLDDVMGKRRNLAEFHGRVVLLYFGFTYCPDVCPTELVRLAELRRRLGAAADRVQVLFVTLDPERDTAAVLGQYVPAFDAGFIGLRGTPDATAAAAREFRVVYQKVRGSAPDRYTIDHSAYVYAIDPAGRLRLRFDPAQSVEQMTDDVGALLAGR